MKKLIPARYLSWIVMLSVTMAVVGTLMLGTSSALAFTSGGGKFFWKTFLVNITFMGDAFFGLGVVLFLLVFLNKKNLSLRLLLTILFSLLMTQVLKNIFSGLPIQLFFESGNRDILGEHPLYRNFISSHVAMALTLAGFFSLFSKSIAFKSVLFVLAFCVAFSRMELMGESVEAIVLGALPALVSTLFIYKFIRKKTSGSSYYYRIRKGGKLPGQQIIHG